MAPRALVVHAGPRAREHLRQHGLRPADVRVIPAAAGGPKGLALIPLDRYLFGHWLPGSAHSVHLLGASIGAWRMAAACLPDADVALAQLAEDYITQSYPSARGKPPSARVVSEVFGRQLHERLGLRAAEVLAHPRLRLHVFTSRGRRWLHRPGRLQMPLGWAAAFAANALSRQALGGWMERVVFSDPREPLPVPLHDYPTHQAALTPTNLAPALLASCTIPFWLEAVQDVPGGPAGSYWDGGITDYHLHLAYGAMAVPAVADGEDGAGAGLVLYPHFGPQVVPGWLDKAWKRRHRASAALDNLVLLSPAPEWLRGLPGGRLPDRGDFKRFAADPAQRQRLWRRALGESQRLADEFAALVAQPGGVDALPLA
ncbi:MAG: phospholipase [Rubrivivax sp.]|nr:phospholipase [Rubrivivax sp.]